MIFKILCDYYWCRTIYHEDNTETNLFILIEIPWIVQFDIFFEWNPIDNGCNLDDLSNTDGKSEST